jgi:hypothetical protein
MDYGIQGGINGFKKSNKESSKGVELPFVCKFNVANFIVVSKI